MRRCHAHGTGTHTHTSHGYSEMTIICCSVHRRFIHEDYLHPCPIRIAAQPNSFYFSRDGMSNCALRFIPPNLCVESRTLSTDPAHCCTRHMHEFSPPSRLTAMGPAVVVTCDSSLLPLLLARGHLGTAALILADHTHTNTRVLVRCGRHDKSRGAAVRLTAAHQARAVPLHHAHTHTGQADAHPREVRTVARCSNRHPLRYPVGIANYRPH